MATRWRLVFDGDNLYTEKEARIYKLTDEIESAIDSIPGVVDDLSSDSSTDALSANMGRILQNQIDSLSWTWIFLSSWDATTWLPDTNPQEDPYTYITWNYYIVSKVWATNYKPHWWTYTQWVPSTAVETRPLAVNDKYYFDWADWLLLPNTSPEIVVDDTLSTTSVHPVQNKVITNALNWKQNTISDLNTIRTWAAKWATALQPGDNITQLTNNAGFVTMADVNTKTFTISSTSDLVNAQQAYEWTNGWWNAIVIYTPERGLVNTWNAWVYSFLYWDSSSPVYVALAPVEESSSQGVGWRSLTKWLLKLIVENWTVTSIIINHWVVVADFLSTSKANHPYTPTNNYDPATKKYVDEAVEDATPSKDVPTDPQDFAYFVEDLYDYYTVNWVPYPIIVKDGKVYVFSRVDTDGTEESIVYLQTVMDNEKHMFGKQIDAIPEYKLVYNNWIFDHDVSSLSRFLLGEVKNWLPYWPIVSTESQQDIETKLWYLINYINTCSINSNAVIIYDWSVYIKTWTYQTDWNYRKISFIKTTPQTSNYTSWTSRTTRAVFNIFCTYDSSTDTYTYDHYTTNTTYSESPYVLRTDYNYPTPYTPAYDGSPATKKYVDDSISSSESNTKTFYLSGAEDIVHAQEAYNWLKAGNVPIIKYQGTCCILAEWPVSGTWWAVSYKFLWTDFDVNLLQNNSISRIQFFNLVLNVNNDVVQSVTNNHYTVNYLSTSHNYSTPYTPQYDGSPATKKYVDDIVWDIESLLANI